MRSSPPLGKRSLHRSKSEEEGQLQVNGGVGEGVGAQPLGFFDVGVQVVSDVLSSSNIKRIYNQY
jgi:hypothetical protein